MTPADDLRRTVSAELLSVPPMSGLFQEVRFCALGACTWVRFTAGGSAEAEWVGVFGGGELGYSKVITSPVSGLAFVLANGVGYLVDANSKLLVFRTDEGCLVDCIWVPGEDRVLACDWVGSHVIARTGVIYRSPRVAIDGMRFTDASSSHVLGQVHALEETADFTIEIGTWEYDCDIVYDHERFVRRRSRR